MSLNISLLFSFSKLDEKILTLRLMLFTESNCILFGLIAQLPWVPDQRISTSRRVLAEVPYGFILLPILWYHDILTHHKVVIALYMVASIWFLSVYIYINTTLNKNPSEFSPNSNSFAITNASLPNLDSLSAVKWYTDIHFKTNKKSYSQTFWRALKVAWYILNT